MIQLKNQMIEILFVKFEWANTIYEKLEGFTCPATTETYEEKRKATIF